MSYALPRGTLLSLAATLLVLSAGALAGEPDAEQMMIAAHEARAAWRHLPGFSADITISTNGETVNGQMTVSATGELDLTLPPSSGSDWVDRGLQSLVRHRLPAATERQFDVSFADVGDTHPLGRLIRFHDDRLHSVYRIQQDEITEVHRTMGDSRFSITVIDTLRNDEGMTLPHVYTVSWWNAATGDLQASEVVTNEWVRVGRWDLPAKLLVVRTTDDGHREVRQVVFRDHRLSNPAIDQ